MHEHGEVRQPDCASSAEVGDGEPESPVKYRARDPAKSPLYRLIEKHYDAVKGLHLVPSRGISYPFEGRSRGEGVDHPCDPHARLRQMLASVL